MNDFKKRATEAFQAVETELIELSRWMYENPETAYQEFESSRRLSETLAGHGFDVTYPAYGIDTAFAATVGESGPRVVICAEYDALPGVGHACGHNIIATSSLGAGIALAGFVEELGMRITVLGTPAEEGGGGKIDLLQSGAFEDAAASMLIHPTHRVRGDLADPRLLAAQGLTVEYNGKEAHAAAAPYAG
ncbi:MAG: M20/M25/M40 family metallo-hydrolase, partial [Acidimicrobiia bacterium]